MAALEAYDLAAQLHTGHVDKVGRPYIEHLTRVFLRVQAAGGVLSQQIAALLHYALEYGHATADELVRIAGVPASGALGGAGRQHALFVDDGEEAMRVSSK